MASDDDISSLLVEAGVRSDEVRKIVLGLAGHWAGGGTLESVDDAALAGWDLSLSARRHFSDLLGTLCDDGADAAAADADAAAAAEPSEYEDDFDAEDDAEGGAARPAEELHETLRESLVINWPGIDGAGAGSLDASCAWRGSKPSTVPHNAVPTMSTSVPGSPDYSYDSDFNGGAGEDDDGIALGSGDVNLGSVNLGAADGDDDRGADHGPMSAVREAIVEEGPSTPHMPVRTPASPVSSVPTGERLHRYGGGRASMSSPVLDEAPDLGRASSSDSEAAAHAESEVVLFETVSQPAAHPSLSPARGAGDAAAASSAASAARPRPPTAPTPARAVPARANRDRVRRGHWRMANRIGAGSFGKVYMGINEDTGRLIAVKVMNLTSSSTADAEHCSVLCREIELMRSLSHPNIVRYLGAEVCAPTPEGGPDGHAAVPADGRGRAGGTGAAPLPGELCIFQEWVPGGSVTSLIEKFGPLKEPVVRNYTRQVLHGLVYLHQNQIIHRDIKGGNVLIDEAGVAKLADFGASKRLTDDGTLSNANDTLRGTPFFMAPEVLSNERYGRKSDVWSIGGLVMQMATGEPPYRCLAFRTPMALFYHVVQSTEPPPMDQYAQLTPAMRALLLRCFDRDEAKRPSAVELLDDPWLRQSLEHGDGDGEDDELEDSLAEIARVLTPAASRQPRPPATPPSNAGTPSSVTTTTPKPTPTSGNADPLRRRPRHFADSPPQGEVSPLAGPGPEPAPTPPPPPPPPAAAAARASLATSTPSPDSVGAASRGTASTSPSSGGNTLRFSSDARSSMGSPPLLGGGGKGGGGLHRPVASVAAAAAAAAAATTPLAPPRTPADRATPTPANDGDLPPPPAAASLRRCASDASVGSGGSGSPGKLGGLRARMALRRAGATPPKTAEVGGGGGGVGLAKTTPSPARVGTPSRIPVARRVRQERAAKGRAAANVTPERRLPG